MVNNKKIPQPTKKVLAEPLPRVASQDLRKKENRALTFSIISALTTVIPLIGLGFAITATILSIKVYRSGSSGAKVYLALILSIFSAAIGALGIIAFMLVGLQIIVLMLNSY